mmetsp:Transcript_42341/g.95299  ORF Transcript_42341/g.95299 Transcript_42341/m.95299 type:complete len:573 (-) Transcript_42341:57-1775(-)
MQEVLDIWLSWPSRTRELALRTRDTEVIGLVDSHMRMLWEAEFKVRQAGLKGLAHPFNHIELPFLSAMQFDGTISKDGKADKLLKWPMDFCQDAEKVPAALRASRPFSGMDSSPLQTLQPSQWCELVKSTPKTWMDLEWQLAQLVTQLVLHAHRQEAVQEGDVAGDRAEAPEGSAGDAEESEDEVEVDLEAAPLTGRAAKRARQRARRRMGRAAAKADKAVGKIPEVCRETSSAVPAVGATLPQVLSNSSLQGLAGTTGVGDLPVEVAPPQGAFPLLGAPTPVPVDFSSELAPPELADAAGRVLPPGLEEGQETIASLTNLWEPEEDFDGNSSGRGMGRGKPLNEGKEGTGHPGGIPFPAMGRGRPLKSSAPVRGSSRQHPMPGGLSQLWMPPPIPEEEVGVEAGDKDHSQFDILISSLAMGNRPYGLSDSDIDIHTPSYWSGGSYAPTPVHAWPETPSPSSNVSPAIRPVSTSAAALALAGMRADFPPFLQLSPPPQHAPGTGFQERLDGGTPAMDTDIESTTALPPPLAGAPIPTYVTVPLAMANSCPHCGKSFAIPPSSNPYAHAIGVT